MEKNSGETATNSPLFLGEGWFDPIEIGIRERVRGFIEELVEEELSDALGRKRYQRPVRLAEPAAPRRANGYRHGRRQRQLLGSFGPVAINVPRARLDNAEGTSREWCSQVLPHYVRMTKPETGWSHSPGCPNPSGDRRVRPMRSSDCTRSSSAGSRRRPCCRQRRPPPCCSGRCSPRARSPCVRSTAGKRWPSNLMFNALTLPREPITSTRRRRDHVNFHQFCDTTRCFDVCLQAVA